MSPFRSFGALLAAALILAGCSSDSSGAVVSSPIYNYLGLPEPLVDESYGDDAIAEENAAEAATAVCMEEQGEMYLPLEFVDVPDDPPEPEGIDPDSREWAERYGLGISTRRFTPEEVGPDLVGVDRREPAPEPVNPNIERWESMSEEEAESYFLVLFGDLASEPFVPGCFQASRLIHTKSAVEVDFVNQFDDDLALLDKDVEADDRIIEITREFEACASDGGNIEPIQIDELLTDLAELSFALDAQGSFTAADLERLGELQRAEIESGMLQFDCGGPLRLQNDYRTIRAEYEEQFIKQHRSRLDELVASRTE